MGRHHVRLPTTGVKRLHHPVVGDLDLLFEWVCCIELSQVIFAGRFAVGTALGAPRPVCRDLISTCWRSIPKGFRQ
jgi:hypothetical protein